VVKTETRSSPAARKSKVSAGKDKAPSKKNKASVRNGKASTKEAAKKTGQKPALSSFTAGKAVPCLLPETCILSVTTDAWTLRVSQGRENADRE